MKYFGLLDLLLILSTLLSITLPVIVLFGFVKEPSGFLWMLDRFSFHQGASLLDRALVNGQLEWKSSIVVPLICSKFFSQSDSVFPTRIVLNYFSDGLYKETNLSF